MGIDNSVVKGVSSVEFVPMRKHGKAHCGMPNNQRLRDVEMGVSAFPCLCVWFKRLLMPISQYVCVRFCRL